MSKNFAPACGRREEASVVRTESETCLLPSQLKAAFALNAAFVQSNEIDARVLAPKAMSARLLPRRTQPSARVHVVALGLPQSRLAIVAKPG